MSRPRPRPLPRREPAPPGLGRAAPQPRPLCCPFSAAAAPAAGRVARRATPRAAHAAASRPPRRPPPPRARPPDAGGDPVFDLVVLGVGPDGHVASLFPNRPELAVTEGWVLPISASPKPPPERITLTLPVINAAKEVMVIALGEGKAEIVQRALEVRGRGRGGCAYRDMGARGPGRPPWARLKRCSACWRRLEGGGSWLRWQPRAPRGRARWRGAAAAALGGRPG
jgi:hypothetical protein